LGKNPTIGISAGLYGTSYNLFLPQWWDGVLSLNRQPDKIIFVHDPQNKNYVIAEMPKKYAPVTKFIEFNGDDFGEFRHLMQVNQTADWFSVCGIDDQYLPGAFDEINQAHAQGCDIYIDKIQLKHNGAIIDGSWIPEEIPHRMTCPGAAPMKLELYKKTGGVTKGTIWDDWELYIRCVVAGAKPYHANTVRIIHDLGYNHKTLSGVNRDASNDQIGGAYIAKVRQELGIE
jgi:hypothetical protein